MEQVASERIFTGSNTSKFHRKNTRQSNYTNSNSVKSAHNRVIYMKEQRRKALQKKSTLLFIQENQENPNDPQSRNYLSNKPFENQATLMRRKTMVEQSKTSNLLFKSRSFKNEVKPQETQKRRFEN